MYATKVFIVGADRLIGLRVLAARFRFERACRVRMGVAQARALPGELAHTSTVIHILAKICFHNVCSTS